MTTPDSDTDPTAGMSEAEAAQWYYEHRAEVEKWDWVPPVERADDAMTEEGQ